jgi:hypothetical protein
MKSLLVACVLFAEAVLIVGVLILVLPMLLQLLLVAAACG